MAKKSGQILFTLIIAGGVFMSACSPPPMIEKEIEHSPEPQPTATLVVPTEIEEIIDEPTPMIDVSVWIVTVGGLECMLEAYGVDYPGWYTLACPEQLWLPIGQITQMELNIEDDESCTLRSIEDFEMLALDLSLEAAPVEFVPIEDGGWGCQIPYSDTAGIKVVCGFECEGDGISVIIFGKTKRVYTGEGSGSEDNDGSEGNQSPPAPPDNPKPPGDSGEEPPPLFEH